MRRQLLGFLDADLLPEQRTLPPLLLLTALYTFPLPLVLSLVYGGPWPAAAAALCALLFYDWALLLHLPVATDAARRD